MKNLLVMNIGLDASKVIEGSKNLAMHTVYDAVTFGLYGKSRLVSAHLAQSASEITAVVIVDFEQDIDAAKLLAKNLANYLKQDAIACLFNNEGFLEGPHAEAWGEFNIDFFVL